MSENFNSLFDQDRTIWVWANRLADVLLVALFWFITSIPIITIGASSTAAYYVYMKMARHEDGYLWKNYWKSFKQNFMQATILWLVQAFIAAGLGITAYTYYIQGTKISAGIMAFFVGLLVVVCIVCIYLPPIICRFSNTTWNLWKTAVFMPFKSFKWTVVLLPLFLAFVFLGWFIIPFIILAYGVYAYISSFIFVKIFKPYEDAIKAKNKALEPEKKETEEISEGEE